MSAASVYSAVEEYERGRMIRKGVRPASARRIAKIVAKRKASKKTFVFMSLVRRFFA